uniref:Variant surface glycoprotein 1125.1358 n=1 Tax=Trypanosoma brucei TaxID=5691 RepID=A0A1J0R730_9TRYP|nr:variant surface glycoprotein 1125.1358 [Trypanosoma brucei]
MFKTKSSRSLGAYTFLTLITVIAVSGEETPEQISKNACGTASLLRIVTETVKRGVLSAVKPNEELNKRIAQATAAALDPTRKDLAKAARALLPVLAKKEAEAHERAASITIQGIPGLISAANFSGQQQNVASLASTEVSDTSTEQNSVDLAASGAANIKFNLKHPNGLAECAGEINKAKDQHDKWAAVSGIKKYNIHTVAALASGSTNRFPALGKGNAGNNACEVNGISSKPMGAPNNQICIAGGPVFTTNKLQLDAGTSGDYGRAAIQDYKETEPNHYVKQAALEIKEALGAVTQAETAFDPNDLGKFTDDNDFIAAVGAIYGNLPRDKATGEAKNTVPNLITEHFGKQENFKTMIWEEIENLKVPATILGAKKEMTLKDVNDIGLATRIMV